MKLNLATANSSRPRLDAEFLHLPELFCETYAKEMLAWANDLVAQGPTLEINLWSPPDSNILSVGYQGTVTLRCDTLANHVERSVLFVIQPDGPENFEKVRLHCEEMPAIMAAHCAKAEATKGTARGAVRAEFNLPEYFVNRYAYELREWGRNLQRIGLVKTIVLREGTLSDLSPDAEQGAVLLGVRLKAEIERMGGDEIRLVISPQTENDARIIAKHVEKMTRVGIPARAELVEPPRPGMPFMPTIAGAKRNADGGV